MVYERYDGKENRARMSLVIHHQLSTHKDQPQVHDGIYWLEVPFELDFVTTEKCNRCRQPPSRLDALSKTFFSFLIVWRSFLISWCSLDSASRSSAFFFVSLLARSCLSAASACSRFVIRSTREFSRMRPREVSFIWLSRYKTSLCNVIRIGASEWRGRVMISKRCEADSKVFSYFSKTAPWAIKSWTAVRNNYNYTESKYTFQILLLYSSCLSSALLMVDSWSRSSVSHAVVRTVEQRAASFPAKSLKILPPTALVRERRGTVIDSRNAGLTWWLEFIDVLHLITEWVLHREWNFKFNSRFGLGLDPLRNLFHYVVFAEVKIGCAWCVDEDNPLSRSRMYQLIHRQFARYSRRGAFRYPQRVGSQFFDELLEKIVMSPNVQCNWDPRWTTHRALPSPRPSK